jgi:hypothetical protein
MVVAVQKDPGVPMISCSIYVKYFKQCLYDLGASVNIMPKVIYEELQYPALSPTMMLVQLADSTVRYPEGIAEHIVDAKINTLESEGKCSPISGRSTKRASQFEL